MNIENKQSFSAGSRLQDYDLNQDTLVDYVGTHHVRILKLFDAPEEDPVESIYSMLMEKDCNKTFHLRFYIPKKALTGKEMKIQNIVIMFNGLDEINRFDLYDMLGQHFAEQGVAAVLLPTPFHLNRSPRPIKGLSFKLPHVELFKRPLLMYYNYKQSMLDCDLLTRKLHNEPPNQTEYKDLNFYKVLFDKNLRISILGFSLGGLRALASFAQEPDKYHKCIVFNSGVELKLLNTEFLNIKKEEWTEFLDELNSLVKKTARFHINDKIYWNYFCGVYLGDHFPMLIDNLKNNSQKLLFILSGADRIVPPGKLNLEVEGHGLTVFKIAGVGHIPTMDPKWSPWLIPIADVIFNFVSQTEQGNLSHYDIIKELINVVEGTNFIETLAYSKEEFTTKELRELLEKLSPEKHSSLLRLYYASMAYYPHFRELLNSIVGWKKSERRKESGTPPDNN